MSRRKFWGWGREGEGPDEAQAAGIVRALAERFGAPELRLAPPPRIEDVALPEPRVVAPGWLAEICSTDPWERASRSYGKSYRDVVRGARGEHTARRSTAPFEPNERLVAQICDEIVRVSESSRSFGQKRGAA